MACETVEKTHNVPYIKCTYVKNAVNLIEK
jgi:hypothetical protein